MSGNHADAGSDDDLRIDKWLWVARFFRTRSAAAEAVRAGHVEVNGSRPKPARHIAVGDEVRVRRGTVAQTVIVQRLARQRVSATVAATLYAETAASIAERERAVQQLRLDVLSGPQFAAGRPTKRDRRALMRWRKRG